MNYNCVFNSIIKQNATMGYEKIEIIGFLGILSLFSDLKPLQMQ